MSNLPQRYAYAVTRNLPEAQREEVAKELQTSIEDMAVDHAGGSTPTEKDYTFVLKELGDPDHMAYKYKASQRYLIGPRFYDMWLRLLKTLLSIVPGIVTAVVLAVSFAEGNATAMEIIVKAVGTGIVVGIHISFWVTLIFIIMERTNIKPESLQTEQWQPEHLPHLPKTMTARQIPMGEGIIGAGLVLVFMAWVVLSPVLYTKDGAPLLNPELWSFWIPAILALSFLTLVHKVALVKVGNWTTPLTVANVVLGLVSIAFVLALTTTQPLLNSAFAEAWGWNKIEGFDEIVRWAGIGVVAAYIWESVQSIILNRRLTRSKNK